MFALDYVLNFIFLALKIEVTTSCFRISRNSDGTISTMLKKTALAGVAIDAPLRAQKTTSFTHES